MIWASLLRALLGAAPDIIRAIQGEDGELAKRRLRERMDRAIDVEIAKVRLRRRQGR